ncbi:MAG TPA: hypothetical protein VMH86_14275 [Rhizomicrobium sp.]|nr:hypothetical protein [Rhizomicrobium sp.]
MNLKTTLLGTVACALMAAPAFAQSTPADTTTTKHHHHHAMAAGSTPTASESRMDRLERMVEDQAAEIRDLKAQINGGGAPAADAVTQAQFEALQNQVYEQQAANTSLTKNSWWARTQVSGRAYIDVSNISDKRDGIAQSVNGTSFDIKRFYIGIDHQFDDTWSANVTTDFNYDSGPAGATQLYLKKAYLQGKFADWLVMRLGSSDMPWIPFVEDLYGYRYVENTLIDRTKFGTSADWGINANGKFGDGMFSYSVSAVNGLGYKKPGFVGGVNRTDGLDVEGRVSMNWDGFTLGVGGYEGHLGAAHGVVTHHEAERFDAVAAYQMDMFRVGVEYFSAKNWNDVTSTNTDSDHGYSGFATVTFDPHWSVFGRYDWVKPEMKTAGGVIISNPKNTYYNFGVTYSPTKIVDLSLVYKHDAATDGFLADQNGTIGGLAQGPGHSGHYNEIGLFTQLRW